MTDRNPSRNRTLSIVISVASKYILCTERKNATGITNTIWHAEAIPAKITLRDNSHSSRQSTANVAETSSTIRAKHAWRKKQAEKCPSKSSGRFVCSRTRMESALPQNASSMNDVDARTKTSFPKIATPNERAAVPRKTRLATAENPRAHSTKLKFFENRTKRFNQISEIKAREQRRRPQTQI